MEDLRPVHRPCLFPQERMTYSPDMSMVVYRAKDETKEKAYDALEWIAAMCSCAPNKGEQMVRYYGYYSNNLPSAIQGTYIKT